MAGWAVKDFGGEIPRRDPRLLANDMAAFAVNTDLQNGALNGLPQPELIVDLTGKLPGAQVRKAYRIPGRTPAEADVWLPLPSEYSSVVRSPLADDTLDRYYWTNPPTDLLPGVWWATHDMIAAGDPPYNLGFVAPTPGLPLAVTNTGGDTGVPQIDRVYTYTFIDPNGLESSPQDPSNISEGYPGATWTITNFPVTPPPSPPGLNYIAPVTIRLYRTITGSSTGANYYFVADLPFGTTSYNDTTDDTTIVNNNTLTTASFLPPLKNMDGLIAYPGGMLMGFTGNTVHFCQPDMPHAWPAGYDTSVTYPIVGLAIWQQALVVLTKGYPAQGSGTTPDTFYFSQINAPEPCISRGSIVTDLAGVYYASQNGLIMLNYFGMQNQTLSNLTKNIWLTEYQAANIVACRHRSQYLAINGTGMGFIIDYAEARLGIVHVTPLINAVSVWNDVYTGNSYMCADEQIWLWDSPNTPPMNYRWRSKEFYGPAPISLGACQISMEVDRSGQLAGPMPPQINPPPTNPPPMPPSGLSLPPSIPAVFRLYFGTGGKNLAHEQMLNEARSIFRLPSGRKAFNWQFEIVSNVEIHSVELATTMKELKKI